MSEHEAFETRAEFDDGLADEVGADRRVYAYVGSRTSRHRDGRGLGIEVFEVPAPNSEWIHRETVNMTNPSFLVPGVTDRVLYAVHGDATTIRTLSVDPATGVPRLVQEADSGGMNPVHAAVSPNGRYLVVANHNSSTVAALPIRDDGALDTPSSVLELFSELGPHRTDQSTAKPHQIVFDPTGGFVLVPAKGADSVFVLELDEDGSLTMDAGRTVRLREMSGPRHLAFHPSGGAAYTIDELRSTVTQYDWDALRGRLLPRQVLSSSPDRVTADSRGAEIAVSADGARVYASNRIGPGDHSPGGFLPDTIVTFDVVDDHSLSRPRWTETAGIRPRFFCLAADDRHLYVAHERSDSIAVHEVQGDGGVGPGAVVARTGSPVSIVFRSF